MPYLPGPFVLQSADNVGIVTSHYDFAGDVADQLGELETTPATWDRFLQDAGALLDEPSDPFPDVDLHAAMDQLGAYADPESILGVNPLLDALGAADVSLAAAIGFAPPQAWQNPPAAFVPPAPAEILLVPQIPAGAVNVIVSGAAPSGGLGSGTGSQLQGPTVTLTNLTAYGSSTFTLGDQWQVLITGVKGQQVYVAAQKDGVDLGSENMGTIGLDGTLTITGQMDVGTIGVWAEQWFVGINLIQSFSFVVLDA